MNEPVIQTKKPRTQYDKAFKQRAVELWLTSGKAAQGQFMKPTCRAGDSEFGLRAEGWPQLVPYHPTG